MIVVFQTKRSPYWCCRYYDRNSMKVQKTMKHLPVAEIEREQAIAEATRDAAVEYFHLLHRQGLWGNLAARLHTTKQMFVRMQDFQPVFTQREFEHLLESVNIVPVPPKQASREKRRVVSIVKRQRHKRNRKFEYKGKIRTLAEWSAECGIDSKVLGMRLKRGWTLEQAMKTPVMSASEGGSIGADRRWMKEKS